MARSFAQQMQDFIDNKVARPSRDVVAGTGLGIFEKVIERTPVDEGRTRGNWNAALNTLDGSVNESRSEQEAIQAVRQMAAQLELGDSFTLVNGMPHIRKLEYGGYPQPGTEKTVNGFSAQAPAGMVGVTVTEFKRAVRQAVIDERQN